jgi:hypothetical protein
MFLIYNPQRWILLFNDLTMIQNHAKNLLHFLQGLKIHIEIIYIKQFIPEYCIIWAALGGSVDINNLPAATHETLW